MRMSNKWDCHKPSLLQNILKHPAIHNIEYDTNFVDNTLEQLLENQQSHHYFYFHPVDEPVRKPEKVVPSVKVPAGMKAVFAPITATVVEIKVTKGKAVQKGDELYWCWKR